MKPFNITLIALALFSWTPKLHAQIAQLPEIRIETQNGAEIVSKKDWVNMSSFVLNNPNNPNHNISFTGAHSDDKYHRIRGRGNTTWDKPKKPFRIRFRENISLFGKEAAENWVLLAEFLDPTYLLNPTAFHLGQILNVPFNHSYQHIHLYLNNAYQGIYIVTEHNQVGKGRVDIDPLEGWLAEMDDHYDSDPKFETNSYSLPVMIKSPDFGGVATDPKYKFVIDDINQLCDAMFSAQFPDNTYRDCIDMDAIINYLMANEIVYSNELFHPKSAYAFKDKGGKIGFGPLWDFDWAFTNLGTHTYFKTYKGFTMKADFYQRFFDDTTFVLKFRDRWNEKHTEINAMVDFIENLSKTVEPHFAKDLERWKNSYGSDYPTDYNHEIVRMKTWWLNRVAWLDTNINKVTPVPSKLTWHLIQTPKNVTLVSNGEITNLSATLKSESNFQIGEIKQTTSSNENFLANITIKIKQIPETEHVDTITVSGVNQGAEFSLKIPLRYVLTNTIQETFNMDIKIYPNPWSKEVHLIGAENCKLRAFSIYGTLVHKQKIQSQSETINLEHLKPGIYFFQIEKNNKVTTLKTIKW